MKWRRIWLKRKCIAGVGVCVLLLGMFTGCDGKGDRQNTVLSHDASALDVQQEDTDKLPEGLRKVIYGQDSFIDVEQKKEFTMNDYTIQAETGESVRVLLGEYIVCDVDGDGERELVVQVMNGEKTDSQDAAVNVLDLQRDTVLCYRYGKDGVANVYWDGVMEGKNAAGDRWFFTGEYSGMECENIRVAERQSICKDGKSGVECFIGPRKVTEEEFEQFVCKYTEKNRLEWMDGLVKN